MDLIHDVSDGIAEKRGRRIDCLGMRLHGWVESVIAEEFGGSHANNVTHTLRTLVRGAKDRSVDVNSSEQSWENAKAEYRAARGFIYQYLDLLRTFPEFMREELKSDGGYQMGYFSMRDLGISPPNSRQYVARAAEELKKTVC